MSLADDIAAAIVTALTPVVSANSGSGPFHQVVPQTTAAFPRVVFNLDTETDANDTKKRAKDFLIAVTVISTVGHKQVNNILEQIEDALHVGEMDETATPLVVDDWAVYWQKREGSTARRADPKEGGGYYFQNGATYRIRLAKEYD